MSNFTPLHDNLSIYGQISEADISMAAENGITTIINLRTEGEKGVTISPADAAKAAADNGIAYHHIPVSPMMVTEDNISEFAKIIDGATGPVLAHCGSGKRAAMLWVRSQAGKISADDLIAKAAAAGHDLSALRSML